ncbi:DsbA family protein [Nocardia sp. IBHARD005]|uniref:DsbA family protein n=1 Tax=Nocardia sp. IBHARD005 TaxID=3457765 RepID=UPI00405805AE
MNTGRKNPLAGAERAERRRRILVQVVLSGVLVALVVAIGVSIAIKKADRDRDATSVIGPVVTPTLTATPGPGGTTVTLAGNGAVRVGRPTAPAVVRVVADLQCPACKAFDATYGGVLEAAIANGSAAVEYDIIAFLDRASRTQYSSRAANASYCAAESAPTTYQQWVKTMFDHQPDEGGDGLPDRTLIEIAKGIGATDPAFERCVLDHRYTGYAAARTEEVMNSGIQSTPSVFVNGTLVAPAQLATAIEAATTPGG